MDNVTIKNAFDWQIYQQIEGFAEVLLEGEFRPLGKNEKVFVRIIREDDLSAVVDWTAVKLSEETADNRENNTFSVKLSVPVGGLYRIDTTIASSLDGIEWSAMGQHIYHVGVGDIFVIAGQSNSAGYGRTPINDPPALGVHLFKNSEKWTLAAHPLNDHFGSVHHENFEPTTAHSPYLAFGKMLKNALNYPIGFIQAALGGSPLSAWNKRLDGRLYKSMVNSVKNCTNGRMKIAGVLWYQGCSDTSNDLASVYFERFSQMVSDMRGDFCDENLPIYTVQINKVLDNENKIWSKIREIQRKAANQIKNVFVIPTTDLSVNDVIHNSSLSNIAIGERLARVALEGFYKQNIQGLAPDIISAEYKDNDIILTFANVSHYISTLSVPAKESQFVVEDENGVVELTKYSAVSNKIYLTASNGTNRPLSGKIRVSYAKTASPNPNAPMDMGSGLPILAFDDFEVENKN